MRIVTAEQENDTEVLVILAFNSEDEAAEFVDMWEEGDIDSIELPVPFPRVADDSTLAEASADMTG